MGIGFHEPHSEPILIDLERTLIETAHAGRDDSRLLFGMRGWLLKHHDLVNGTRLIRLVKSEKETAILGAIIDSVLEEESRSTLRYVKKYCRKAKTPEFVFNRIASSPVQSERNREENLTVWKRWNLISREMESSEGAIMEKPYVLKHNRNLALRALFGPILKADLLAYFLEYKQGNAHQVAQALGQSYEPVYHELQSFKEIGFMEDEKAGLSRVFKIKSPARSRLNALAGLEF